MIHDYNQHMMGVDRLDQMMAYYNFERKSVKWWRKVFFWVLEAMVTNSYVLYREADPEGVPSAASDVVVPRYSSEANSHSTSC